MHSVEPEVFKTYAHWLYFSELNMRQSDSDLRNDSDDPTWMRLTNTWIFAQGVVENELCNQIADFMLEKFERNTTPPDATVVDCLWKHVADESKLKVLFTDIWACTIDQGYARVLDEKLPLPIVHDMAVRYMAGEQKYNYLIHSMADVHYLCRYHQPRADGQKCATMVLSLQP